MSELRAMPAEKEWLEFKENNGQDLGQYISALSNSACIHEKEYAYIVFGIQDETHRIIGTTFDLNQKGKGNEDLIPWITRKLTPKIHFECHEFKAEDEKIILIRIQSTINTPVKFDGVSYIRIGSYKSKLDEHPEKQRLIWNKKPGSVFEKGISMYGVDANEVLILLDYPSYFELMKIPLPENRDAIFEKFVQEKIIAKNGAKYDITNLGGILLAKQLNSFETLERKAVRVIIYQGKNKFNTKKEQVGIKGYASGFYGLINYINDQLPVNEEIGKAFRKEVKMFPELAVRELVANAIIHQDFSITGTGPMVDIFDDRIEISNPGKPIISTMRFVDHNPQSRNEKLAGFMRRMNICEERGSGIDKVIFECEYYQLPAPKFIEGQNFTRVILYAHKSLRQMTKEDKSMLYACISQVCFGRIYDKSNFTRSIRY